MARITIEDCISKVSSRFELAVLVSQRAHNILTGAKKMVKCNNKEIVTALREIAESKIDLQALRAELLVKYGEYGVREQRQSASPIFFADHDIDNIIFSENDMKAKSNIAIDADLFGSENIDVDD